MADGTQQAWIQGLSDALAWGMLGAMLFLVPLVALFSRVTRRRRFWCALSRRDVEVEFEESGLPGLRRPVAVKSCSIFDPPTAVECRRRCLDSDFRRQWDTTLPVRFKNG
jgi:hypothetical protein